MSYLNPNLVYNVILHCNNKKIYKIYALMRKCYHNKKNIEFRRRYNLFWNNSDFYLMELPTDSIDDRWIYG